MSSNKKIYKCLIIIFIISLLFQTLLAADYYCIKCSKKITGQYQRLGPNIYCQNCYSTLPKCYNCGFQTDNYITLSTGKIYCKNCLSFLYICSMCGNPLTAGGVEVTSRINGESRKYCTNCYNNNKDSQCFCCGLFTFKFYTLYDGRILCENCYNIAVYDKDKIRAIYYEVYSCLKRNKIIEVKGRPTLYIISEPQLMELSEDSTISDYLGTYITERHYFKIGNYKKPIITSKKMYILDFLPTALLRWVIAHEYAHAWYFDNVKKDFPPEMVEGFAEWIAYKYIMLSGTEDDKKIAYYMKTKEDIYGKGLRTLLDMEKKLGTNSVINYFKTAK